MFVPKIFVKEMWSLFDTGGSQPGYRLKRLEVFNWGTFHEGTNHTDVWKIAPEGQNCLLTGANGSGKTTLVDALLSLLVNPSKRFFNQSSGAEKRRNRTEDSYVEGHYGKSQNEEQMASRIDKLRPNRDETYSVILGVFTSEGATPVTLAQVRYFLGDRLKTRYLVAKLEMSIAKDIQYDSAQRWPRKLKSQYAERISFFDSFTQYAEDFKRKFGMRSDKALTLFNQTVGMKILGDLNEFIRTNMLEESTAEAEFGKMMLQYQSLLTSFQALEKARIQLDLLRPVYELNHEHQRNKSELRLAHEQARLLEPWFVRKQGQIWAREIKTQRFEFERLEDKLAQQEERWEAKDKQRVGLEVAIGNNQITRQIEVLDREILSLNKSKKEKETYLKDYDILARKLEFTEGPDEAAFQENLRRAEILQAELQAKRKRLEGQKQDGYQLLRDLKVKLDLLESEIGQLERSSNKITGRVAEIHQEIFNAVDAGRNEIPFVAELIQVRAEEKAVWNAAIEKLLHGFGLCLLVPDHYYSEVNQYVNSQRDLRGRIKYFRVGKATLFPSTDERLLVNKLEFNEKSPYAAWVENRVAEGYGYICVENRTEFEGLKIAVLPSGLSRNKDTHERNDSQAHRQILGWDNKALLRELKSQAREVSSKIAESERALALFGKQSEAIASKEILLPQFFGIKQFSKLDWRSDALQINDLEEKRVRLENSSDKLKASQQQLKEIKTELENLQKERDDTRDAFKESEKLIARLETEERAQQHFIDNFDAENLEEALGILEEITREIEAQLAYASFSAQKDSFEDKMNARIKQLEASITSLETRIRSAMSAFKLPSKEVRDKFTNWDNETYNLKTEIDQLPEYVDLYQQIKNDNLAELEERFRKEFTTGSIRALANFVNTLDHQHNSIALAIDDINKSLRHIDFDSTLGTYIQLERRDTTTPRIRDFRHDKLDRWQPDRTKIAMAEDPQLAEIDHFVERIQPFIQELNGDEKWRQEVTDVRNWSTFKAQEYHQADDRPGKLYEDSGGLSGGEAAQLAYTVLGASLAHQYGISNVKSSRSFRLIVVDEAFSKLDGINSKYLLELCKGLGLQMMVVTPGKDINLLENDVSFIHWVTKSPQNRNKSIVRDMSILEYKKRKDELLGDEKEEE